MRYPMMAPCVVFTSMVLLFAGCSADPGASDPTTAPPDATLPNTAAAAPTERPVVETDLGPVEILADELNAPWSMVFYQGATLLSERDTSRIVELDEHGVAREVAVIDQTAKVPGEGGLLGLAMHDNQLYAYQTTVGDNRIIRFTLRGEPGGLELTEPEIIFVGIPAAGHHNGGRIAFGPDGMLYITTGDALEPSRSQDLESIAGKILRITPEGEIPEDNPFEGSPVYSYGHRNVQGLAWTLDGTMYASEFGENAWDELNKIEPGGNYGWPVYEGAGGDPQYIDPIHQWAPSDASPSAIEIHDGSIYMAALHGQQLWEIPLDASQEPVGHLEDEFGRLRDVTTAPDGSLWVLTNNTDGVGTPNERDDLLLRIDP